MADIESIADANVLRQQFEKRALKQEHEAKPVDGPSIIIVGAGAFGSSLALELVTNYRDKYCVPKDNANGDTCASMSSINGPCHPATLHPPIQPKSSEQTILQRYMPRLQGRQSSYGRQICSRERIIKQVITIRS